MKLTISERWDKLLKETTKQAEEYYKRLETVELEKPPMQAQLHKNMEKFIEGIDWTMSHIVWAFNLPTAYFAPGQEDIQFEDAKIRIAIDPKKAKLEEFSNQQLEDVANGWRTHIRRILKDFKDKVSFEFNPSNFKNVTRRFCCLCSSNLKNLRRWPNSSFGEIKSSKCTVFLNN